MAGRFFSGLFGCFSKGSRSDENQSDQDQREEQLASHLYGQYSMASAQANVKNEDRFQLKSGPLSNLPDGPTGVFVGIYDGHGGDFCSKFIYYNLFNTLKSYTTYHHGLEDPLYVIREAYYSIENNFVAFAKSNWEERHYLATVGSCCLTGVVHGSNLYVANAGDSRAVLARWADGEEQPQVVQLSTDHNANDEDIRHEVEAEHPGVPNLFTNVHGSYRLKGTLQVDFFWFIIIHHITIGIRY
ncbi:hypothetical protein LUZ61_017470 [Rhynchospora tenuis]|uniref:protein-serine/threonine phosphatase n=1 Tax=Rhynchospora tenuis TaxID=198213 RepID=A0AAD6EL15_9POAL|nr:hypothetical protein LUZ61_017470 [Rhynchospora tenuis]